MIKSLAVALVLVHWICAPATATALSLADYSTAIKLAPFSTSFYYNRAVLKRPDASADFEAAFRLNPSLRATYSEFYETRRKP